MRDLQGVGFMSASHEKSPTESDTKHSTPAAASSTVWSVIGVPICATLACWQVRVKILKDLVPKSGPFRMDQIPAAPTGLAVDQLWDRQ